jgi:hypothetical protein
LIGNLLADKVTHATRNDAMSNYAAREESMIAPASSSHFDVQWERGSAHATDAVLAFSCAHVRLDTAA